jgi:hypothetical protein
VRDVVASGGLAFSSQSAQYPTISTIRGQVPKPIFAEQERHQHPISESGYQYEDEVHARHPKIKAAPLRPQRSKEPLGFLDRVADPGKERLQACPNPLAPKLRAIATLPPCPKRRIDAPKPEGPPWARVGSAGTAAARTALTEIGPAGEGRFGASDARCSSRS